jgi:hypothetical protein
MALINSPFKDRVVPATNKKVGQDCQQVGPAKLTVGISLPGSTAQGMVTSLVKGK